MSTVSKCLVRETEVNYWETESNALCQNRAKKHTQEKKKETYSGKEKMSQGFYIQEECLSIIKGRDKSLLKSNKLVKIIPVSPSRGTLLESKLQALNKQKDVDIKTTVNIKYIIYL